MCVVEIADAVGGIINLNQQKTIGKYRTLQLINQGKEAENNAAIVRQEGIETARKQKLNAILNMAKTKTNAAANNLAMSSETVLNLENDDIMHGNLNAEETLKKSERRAEQYIKTANNYYQNAALNSFQTKRNYRTGIFSLGAKSILESAVPYKSSFSKISKFLIK